MNDQLQNQLFAKYAGNFRDHTKSPQESCLSFGVETGDGWYHILDHLCATLKSIEERLGAEVIFDQVKEKYGTLRVYYHIEYGPRWTPVRQLFPWRLERYWDWSLRHFWRKPCFVRRLQPSWKLDGKLRVDYFSNGWAGGGKKMLATERVEAEVELAIRVADEMSEIVCEKCGVTGATQNQGGWITTLCDACRKKREEPEPEVPPAVQAGLEMNAEEPT